MMRPVSGFAWLVVLGFAGSQLESKRGGYGFGTHIVSCNRCRKLLSRILLLTENVETVFGAMRSEIVSLRHRRSPLKSTVTHAARAIRTSLAATQLPGAHHRDWIVDLVERCLRVLIPGAIGLRASANGQAMHLAKGLEFRAVGVMACDDEIIPLHAGIDTVGEDSDLKEVYNTERQLLYVASTRARDFLLVTGVEPASEFLDDLKV
jgi:hypothetical protein